MNQRREEIIEEIVDNLRPWIISKAAVLKAVDGHIDLLFKGNAERGKWARGAECKKAAQGLNQALDALVGVVNGLHPWASDPLFNYVAMRLADEDRPPPSVSEFLRHLRALREASTVLEHTTTPSKKADLTKACCAGTAYRLICECSKNPPTGTPDAPLRTIATLLYEVLTGRQTDLKRACDDQLKRERAFREQVRSS
jgi:hypothetical protein